MDGHPLGLCDFYEGKALKAMGLLPSGIHNRGSAKSFQQHLNHPTLSSIYRGQQGICQVLYQDTESTVPITIITLEQLVKHSLPHSSFAK